MDDIDVVCIQNVMQSQGRGNPAILTISIKTEESIMLREMSQKNKHLLNKHLCRFRQLRSEKSSGMVTGAWLRKWRILIKNYRVPVQDLSKSSVYSGTAQPIDRYLYIIIYLPGFKSGLYYFHLRKLVIM